MWLPLDEAQRQYRARNPKFADDGVLCTMVWSGYWRVQTGSAPGTQSLEWFNDHELRSGKYAERPAHFVTLNASVRKKCGEENAILKVISELHKLSR